VATHERLTRHVSGPGNTGRLRSTSPFVSGGVGWCGWSRGTSAAQTRAGETSARSMPMSRCPRRRCHRPSSCAIVCSPQPPTATGSPPVPRFAAGGPRSCSSPTRSGEPIASGPLGTTRGSLGCSRAGSGCAARLHRSDDSPPSPSCPSTPPGNDSLTGEAHMGGRVGTPHPVRPRPASIRPRAPALGRQRPQPAVRLQRAFLHLGPRRDKRVFASRTTESDG
jgi:hypothetical protein